jgi:hypothetical protein
MSAEQRKAELELSLAKRKARGAITREDIAAGKGSGSIADFLHANVAQKMLDEAEKEDKIDQELGVAQRLVDEVEAANPDDSTAIASETRRLARERGLTPSERARAESLANSRASEIRTNTNTDRTETFNELGQMLMMKDDNGAAAFTYDTLPPNMLRKLPPQLVSQLQSFESRFRNGEQFARSTNWRMPQYDKDGLLTTPSYSAWMEMTPAQKAEVDLESPSWYNSFELPVWKQLQDEQEKIRTGGVKAEKAIQTLDQIVTDVWTGEMRQKRTGRNDDDDQMFYLMRSQIADEVDRISDTEFGGQYIGDDRIKEVARKIMGRKVMQRDAAMGFTLWGRDSKKPIPIVEVDPDDFRDYYVPLNDWKDLQTPPIPIGPNGELVQQTWYEFLESRAKKIQASPNQKDYENAYAQIVIGGTQAEVDARVDKALRGGMEY